MSKNQVFEEIIIGFQKQLEELVKRTGGVAQDYLKEVAVRGDLPKNSELANFMAENKNAHIIKTKDGFVVMHNDGAVNGSIVNTVFRSAQNSQSFRFQKYNINGVAISGGAEKQEIDELMKLNSSAQGIDFQKEYNKLVADTQRKLDQAEVVKDIPKGSALEKFVAEHEGVKVRKRKDSKTGEEEYIVTYINKERRAQTGFASVFQSTFDKNGKCIDNREISKSLQFQKGQFVLDEQMKKQKELQAEALRQVLMSGHEND